MFQSIIRNGQFVSAIARTFPRIASIKPDKRTCIADFLEKVVDQHGTRIALMDAGGTLTYQQLDTRANRYANWARAKGIARGAVVGLMMENRPEFVVIWFGLQKLGATVSLINTNLVGKPLAHCIDICECDHLIVGAELGAALESIGTGLERSPEIWSSGGALPGANDLDRAIEAASPTRPPASVRDGITGHDRAFFIYTSGTTGNPKAAVISQARWLMASGTFSGVTNVKPEDRMYLVLPLYHSTGGLAALGSFLSQGASIFIKRKFKATDFWSDCVKYEATRFQYVGELCRYLVKSPKHPDEQRHGIKLAQGNGLRPDVWPEFQERFAIPRVFEFYGATEGNITLFNFAGHQGAVGHVPRFARKLFDARIVKFDIESEIPVRDENGLCIECGDDEPGEILGRIKPGDMKTSVEGYTDETASKTKILHNVFAKGDQWFRSGDLMRKDRQGYFYFVDRIGDTFRWKGENVSTAEVAEIISSCPGVEEVNVFGVKVGDADGRAGMASLVTSQGFDFESLYDLAAKNLPQYAIPVFIRLQDEIEITGTFKHRKVELVKDGFDPARTPDPLYFLDPGEKRYIAIDSGLHSRIVAGEFRF